MCRGCRVCRNLRKVKFSANFIMCLSTDPSVGRKFLRSLGEANRFSVPLSKETTTVNDELDIYSCYSPVSIARDPV